MASPARCPVSGATASSTPTAADRPASSSPGCPFASSASGKRASPVGTCPITSSSIAPDATADPIWAHRAVLSDADAKSMSAEALHRALGEIAELDQVLADKQAYLKALVHERRALERGASSARLPLEEDEEEQGKRLTLVPAGEDEGAFLTQAGGTNVQENMSSRASVAGDSIATPKSGSGKKAKSLEHLFNVKQDFDKNDFISRNKAMGAEARYYSALTPLEQDRVDRILIDDSNDDLADDTAASPSNIDDETLSTISIATTAFSADAPDARRLDAIHRARFTPTAAPSALYMSATALSTPTLLVHRELARLVPSTEWAAKADAWSGPATGWATPSTPASSAKDDSDRLARLSAVGGDSSSTLVGDGAEDARVAAEEKARLAMIDAALDAVRQGASEERPITREDLDKLLLSCLRDEIVKHQPLATVDKLGESVRMVPTDVSDMGSEIGY
ncbi:hypothetical protein GGF32_004487 [Allomyces javanicus]|nr:hypothetical protein GGF32_004487 [Allomyces javanicus]